MKTGHWTFHGDLPNPVWANDENPEGIPAVSDDNTYSPLRKVTYNGKEVIFNALFSLNGGMSLGSKTVLINLVRASLIYRLIRRVCTTVKFGVV